MSEWIEWSGGECPVPKGTVIDVKYRDGSERLGAPALTIDNGTGAAFWVRDDVDQDIVAYRLAPQVDHPAHYNAGSVECIDAIRAALTPEEFRGFCKGNALKYIWRERHKGGDESMEKAQWYLNELKNGLPSV